MTNSRQQLEGSSDPDGFVWKPTRTLAECDAMITQPGQLLQTELAFVDGRVMKVYKNLWPNVRAFWLSSAARFSSRDYIVYESERYTYAEASVRVNQIANILRERCGVRCGDRVAILMRNVPEFIFTFYAAQILGAVPAMVNAWLPVDQLLYCLELSDPRVIVVDGERAGALTFGLSGGVGGSRTLGKDEALQELRKRIPELVEVFVVRDTSFPSSLGPRHPFTSFDNLLSSSNQSPPPLPTSPLPSSPATLFFTSGTTGRPKAVLSSQHGFLCNIFNILAGRVRSVLRAGGGLKDAWGAGEGWVDGRSVAGGGVAEVEEQKTTLLAVPMFHVTGMTSTVLVSTAIGGKIVLMRKWDKEEAARLIRRERVTSAGGVPSMVMDIMETSLGDESESGADQPLALENLACGGAPAPGGMPKDVWKKYKGVSPGQGYGLSETNAMAVGFQGEDFVQRPESTGTAVPVVDLLVVDPATNKILKPNEVGELWIRGPNIMMCYWRDPAATKKSITRDGWFKTGDLACIDEEGFVYIKDRVKDIIIRGGENIHSIEVENALYALPSIIEAAAVSVPDRRLGELVAAVVATKPSFHGTLTEEDVINGVKSLLPAYAVPVMVLIQSEALERNVAGKIRKDVVRKRAREEWDRRQRQGRSKEKAVLAKL